jgi:hypothetical protein
LPWMARDHIPKKIAVLPKGGDTRGTALHRAASKRLRSDEPALSAMLSQNCDLPTAAMLRLPPRTCLLSRMKSGQQW